MTLNCIKQKKIKNKFLKNIIIQRTYNLFINILLNQLFTKFIILNKCQASTNWYPTTLIILFLLQLCK